MIPHEHLSQLLHNVTTAEVKTALFVVASETTIIYVVVLTFKDEDISTYDSLLSLIVDNYLEWTKYNLPFDDSKLPSIPEEGYKALKDQHTLKLWFIWYRKFCEMVKARGSPFPSAHRILPWIVVYWNLMKGGVDEFSRTFKNVQASFQSLSPNARVVIRTILTQVYNAHHIRRLFIIENKLDSFKNLTQLTNAIKKIGSFRDSVKILAKTLELAGCESEPELIVNEEVTVDNDSGPVPKLSARNLTKVEWLNTSEGMDMRLRGKLNGTVQLIHLNAKMQHVLESDVRVQLWCVLCSSKTVYCCSRCVVILNEGSDHATKTVFPLWLTIPEGKRKTCFELFHTRATLENKKRGPKCISDEKRSANRENAKKRKREVDEGNENDLMEEDDERMEICRLETVKLYINTNSYVIYFR